MTPLRQKQQKGVTKMYADIKKGNARINAAMKLRAVKEKLEKLGATKLTIDKKATPIRVEVMGDFVTEAVAEIREIFDKYLDYKKFKLTTVPDDGTSDWLIKRRQFPAPHMDNPVAIRSRIRLLKGNRDGKVAERERIKEEVPQAYKESPRYKYLTAYISKLKKRIIRWEDAMMKHDPSYQRMFPKK
jgi:hypothetical protein